jgi:uncharacterized membrane protein
MNILQKNILLKWVIQKVKKYYLLTLFSLLGLYIIISVVTGILDGSLTINTSNQYLLLH